MRELLASIRRFLIEDDGPTAVEYAVMGVFVIVVVFQTVKVIGTITANMYKSNFDAIR